MRWTEGRVGCGCACGCGGRRGGGGCERGGKGEWGGSKKWGCGTSKSQKEGLLKKKGAGMSNVEQGEAGGGGRGGSNDGGGRGC